MKMISVLLEKGKTMSDYIKREDALEQFDYYDLGEYLTTQIRGMLMDVPSADVAPVRHGRWIEHYKSDAPPTLKSRWVCSWCGNVQTYGATGYCPNCGARMDGESDDE